LKVCIDLGKSEELIVVVPNRFSTLKETLLNAVLVEQMPSVMEFCSFITWRTASAEVDQKWPRGRAVIEMLAAYNHGVFDVGGDVSMLVDLPPDLAWALEYDDRTN
jgi:hypothetical protein